MSFFEKLEIKSQGYMFFYLLLCSLFFFTGYLFYGIDVLVCPAITSVEAAVILSVSIMLTPFVAAWLLSLFSDNLADREVESRELVAVLAYPVSFILLSGIFASNSFTLILHYLLVAYSFYLLYSAVTARFGFEKAIFFFVLFLIAAVVVFMVFFWSGTTLINLSVAFFKLLGFSSADIPLRAQPFWCY